MYVEDQDEEVEEEEEFHEVEEEKHKTSQESVGSSSNEPKTTSPISENESAQTTDQDVRATSENKIMSENVKSDLDRNDEPKEKSDGVNLSDVRDEGLETKQDLVLKAEKEASESKDNITTNEQIESDSKTTDASPKDAILQSEQILPHKSEQIVEKKISPDNDWANIMLNSESKTPEVDSTLGLDNDHGIESLTLQTCQLKIQDDPASPAQNETSEVQQAECSAVSHSKLTVDELSKEDQKSDEGDKKELDLDEDEENPQYIPKKGDFYEHDDRSHKISDEGSSKKDDSETETRDPNLNKKISNQDKSVENRRSNRRQRSDADRWNHDLFRDEKQKPKSTNAQGYDVRQQERVIRNQNENRIQRSTNAPEKSQGSQENRSRQSRDGRVQRQNQTGANRSRERRPRRQNMRNSTRNDNSQLNNRSRDPVSRDNRSRAEVKDAKETNEEKQHTQQSNQGPLFSAPKKDYDNRESRDNRNTRTDSRGRRRNSRDRPNTKPDDRLPPPNSVMPPITTWSNEDMVKAEAFSKDSPSRQQPTTNSSINATRNRANEFWSQGQPSKNMYQDRPTRNHDDSRHQGYNLRGRYQDRGEEMPRLNHFGPRNQFNERVNHSNQDWHRNVSYNNAYSKPSEYVVKTQTFENSRLAQANRSNNRDLRDVLNERRMQGQQNFQNKFPHNLDHRNHMHSSQYNHHGQQHIIHQPHVIPNNQGPTHMLQQQMQHQQSAPHIQSQTNPSVPSPQEQLQAHQSQQTKQAEAEPRQQSLNQTSSQAQQQSLEAHRQQGAAQARIDPMSNNVGDSTDGSLNPTGANNNDSLNSRPIIKTDAYTGTTGLAQHSPQQAGHQHLSQHSQNHRALSGSMTQQQGPSPPGSHMIPSHMGASSIQTQYYTPSNSTRDPAAAAAAMASAYHGYIPSGHTVMDSATRYHMTSQQMSDHGYMASPAQAGDVTAGPVMHQQGLYPDAATGGTVASSAYMAQAGSTLSPSSTIPVTGSGGHQPLPPVSYIQHSQYPPPPYSNPYSQHQHGQGPPPPHSGQAYPPYWSYI